VCADGLRERNGARLCCLIHLVLSRSDK
jgi:hypothetical protein